MIIGFMSTMDCKSYLDREAKYLLVRDEDGGVTMGGIAGAKSEISLRNFLGIGVAVERCKLQDIDFISTFFSCFLKLPCDCMHMQINVLQVSFI